MRRKKQMRNGLRWQRRVVCKDSHKYGNNEKVNKKD